MWSKIVWSKLCLEKNLGGNTSKCQSLFPLTWKIWMTFCLLNKRVTKQRRCVDPVSKHCLEREGFKAFSEIKKKIEHIVPLKGGGSPLSIYAWICLQPYVSNTIWVGQNPRSGFSFPSPIILIVGIIPKLPLNGLNTKILNHMVRCYRNFCCKPQRWYFSEERKCN